MQNLLKENDIHVMIKGSLNNTSLWILTMDKFTTNILKTNLNCIFLIFNGFFYEKNCFYPFYQMILNECCILSKDTMA